MRARRALDRHGIAEILPGVLGHIEQRHGTLFAIQRQWTSLVGKALATHTQPVSVRRGRLTVIAERPGDGFALAYQRTQLLERLQTISHGTVEELVVRPGGRTRS